MTQPALFPALHYTVTQLTFRIRKLLEGDAALQDVWVDGELSNVSRPASGHVYFTLKDKGASLRCVMWRSDASRLQMPLQDGMAVEAHGRIAVYEPQGQYQSRRERRPWSDFRCIPYARVTRGVSWGD